MRNENKAWRRVDWNLSLNHAAAGWNFMPNSAVAVCCHSAVECCMILLQWEGRKTLLGTDTMFLGILRYCSEQCCINHIHCSAIGTMLQSRKVHKPRHFYADIFYPVLHKIIKKCNYKHSRRFFSTVLTSVFSAILDTVMGFHAVVRYQTLNVQNYGHHNNHNAQECLGRVHIITALF